MDAAKKARLLLPKPKAPNGSDSNQENTAPLKRKRDKALAACEGCRKRKVRCDGIRPACSQCMNSNVECRYPVPEGMTPRESQKQQVEQASNLRTVLEMLRQRSDVESISILKSIREASTLDDAVGLIADANLLLPALSSPQGSSPRLTPILESSAFDIRELSASLNSDSSRNSSIYNGLPIGALPLSQWTSVSQDDKHLTHLLNLFWTWDHTLCRVVDRTMFLEDLTGDPNVEVRFCSQFLVNSLMAVASIYYKQDNLLGSPIDHSRAFADEALQLLETERNYQSITLVQGLALLWVYEGNCGKKSRAVDLLNELYHVHECLGLSITTIPTGTRMAEPAAQRKWHAISCICWGFYSLLTKLSLAFVEASHVSKPRIIKMFENEAQFLAYTDMTIHLWSPYPLSSLPRCSLSQEAFQAECVLAELIEQVLSLVASRSNTGQALVPDYDGAVKLYRKMADWKALLPDNLQAFSNILPSVVFLHTTFDMAILKLLGPFAHGVTWMFGIDGTASTLRLTHAMTLISNIWAYRATFGPRHEYWLMQACFSAAESVIGGLGTSTASTEVFTRACRILFNTGTFLPLANDFLLVLKGTLLHSQAPMPPSVAKIFSGLSIRSGNISIKGVRLALPLYSSKGIEITSSVDMPQDVNFSDKIGDIAE